MFRVPRIAMCQIAMCQIAMCQIAMCQIAQGGEKASSKPRRLPE
jgi:hypothetical protein